jgi:PKD repeat protein
MKPLPLLGIALTMMVMACESPLAPPANRTPAASPATASAGSGSAPEIAYFYCSLTWGESGEAVAWWSLLVTYADGSGRSVAEGDELCRIEHRAAWSPDASRIAFADEHGEVTVVTIADWSLVNLTDHLATDRWPAWSPDGTKIVFQSDRDGQPELYIMDADGSNVVRLTHTGIVDGSDGNPTWSPDGARIAFTCSTESGREICAVNADGSGLVQITDDPREAFDPDWSPDGARIVFTTARYAETYWSVELAVMNTDGSGVTRLGGTVGANDPDWSPDGTRIVYTAHGGACDAGGGSCEGDVRVVNSDGSGNEPLLYGHGAAWAPAPPPLPPEDRPPFAHFTYGCSLLTCSFDGSTSFDDGGIVSWRWDFGDGQTSVAPSPSHTYAAVGTYDVTLTVTDGKGYADASTITVTPDAPPDARFGYGCSRLTCTFDGGVSVDDYGIVAWRWDFGDGQGSTSPNPSHTYGAPGTWVVSLTVTDGSGSADSQATSITVTNPITITLRATGSVLPGKLAVADLSWSGASTANVEVYRNGVHLVTTPNDGAYRDSLGRRVRGTYTYRVCNAGPGVCSEPVSVSF